MVSAARLIFGGVLDRFPTLKFGFFEGGIGWVPWLMHTLDAHMPNEDSGIRIACSSFSKAKKPFKKMPSQYFDQFYIAGVSWETYLADTINGWPNHNIIIGSDFDHGDAVATWPRTVDVIKQMPSLVGNGQGEGFRRQCDAAVWVEWKRQQRALILTALLRSK